MENKNKCIVCDKEVSVDNRFKSLMRYRNVYCDDCEDVAKLQEINIKHWDAFQNAKSDDQVEQRNYFKTREDKELGIESFTLDDYDEKYDVKSRFNNVQKIIDEIDYARKHIYTNIKPYMIILESMFDKKYKFWGDGGNYWVYVKDSLVSYLAIQIREYFDISKQNRSKLSLYRFKNIIQSNKKRLYLDSKITYSRKFKNSGETSVVSFTPYPIDEYLKQLDIVLEKYDPIIKSIEDYRDNVYAHVGELKNKEDHQAKMTLINFRKIVNTLTIIFDGLSYSIAPDKYVTIAKIDYNIYLNRLNEISMYYEENVTKKIKERLNKNKHD